VLPIPVAAPVYLRPLSNKPEWLSMNCRQSWLTLADIGDCQLAWAHLMFSDDEVEAIG